ncbi:MAG: hypothetical protein IKH51_03295 [Clostridia bacterium]|nr:hypothetical protein [Clostridia bacterium]
MENIACFEITKIFRNTMAIVGLIKTAFTSNTTKTIIMYAGICISVIIIGIIVINIIYAIKRKRVGKTFKVRIEAIEKLNKELQEDQKAMEADEINIIKNNNI